MAGDDEISEAGRMAGFEQWEKLGLDRVKSDLQADPHRRIGSGLVQNLAWEWVRMKEAERAKAQAVEEKPAEMVTLNPNFHGIGIDLKEAARRLRRCFKKGS